jgi:hypothetical protein
MITRVDARLRREASQLSLRFGCEDCALFDVDHAGCSHGYPVEPHLHVRLEVVDQLEFCKEFELA